TRNEYEKQLMTAKKNAERIQKETDLANEELLILLRDVKNKKEQLEQLNHELKTLAEHDELTGLLNRRAFGRHLNFVFEEAYHNNESFSLAILDIDHFKLINDTYGHPVGDLVLKELARKMESIIEPPHLIARIGGEEFAIIFY